MALGLDAINESVWLVYLVRGWGVYDCSKPLAEALRLMSCDRTDDGHAEEEHGAGAAGRPHLGGTREEAGEDATHGELIEQGWCSRSEREVRYQNLFEKVNLLKKRGREAEAAEARKKARCFALPSRRHASLKHC